jgi:hypothetical protein
VDGVLKESLTMFLFFSNKLGCLGSIVLSIVATLVLLFVFGVL